MAFLEVSKIVRGCVCLQKRPPDHEGDREVLFGAWLLEGKISFKENWLCVGLRGRLEIFGGDFDCVNMSYIKSNKFLCTIAFLPSGVHGTYVSRTRTDSRMSHFLVENLARRRST